MTPRFGGLTARQRFEIAVLDDWQGDARGYGERLADLIRYVAREGIIPDRFDNRDSLRLNGGYTAAVILADRANVSPGYPAYDALAAASVLASGEGGAS